MFKQQVQAGNVVSVTGVGDTIRGTLKEELRYPPDATPAHEKPSEKPLGNRPAAVTSKEFQTLRPAFADPGLEALLESQGVVIDARDEGGPSWLTLLIGFGPTLLLIGAFIWFSQRAAGAGGGGVFSLGKSRAKRYSESEAKVSFADVAGIDEECHRNANRLLAEHRKNLDSLAHALLERESLDEHEVREAASLA